MGPIWSTVSEKRSWGGVRLFAAVSILLICAISLVGAFAEEACAKSGTVKIKLSAVGDCAFYNEHSGHSYFDDCFNQYGPDYFFSKVKPIFDKDDITIANFEGTLTEATKRKIKNINFKGPAKYVRVLKNSSIEVVNLANNHTRDYLGKGFRDTKRTLTANGIPYCYKTKIAYKTVKGVKVAFLGFNRAEIETFTKRQVKAGINRAKRNGATIIVVSMHWGKERRYMPNPTQKKLGRYAIDCGASIVIGHHPHVLQGIEKYKGKCIIYSLGNFCFGGNSNPYDKDTMIYQQTFTVKNGELTNKFDAKAIPCMVSGNLVFNNCQPCIPAEKKYQQQVMGKIKTLCKVTRTNVLFSGKIL